MEDLERLRLRKANELVSEVKGTRDEERFSQLAERLTGLLAGNGLLLTVAYLQRKERSERKEKGKPEEGKGKDEEEKTPEGKILEFMGGWLEEIGLIEGKNPLSIELLLDLDPGRLPLIFDEVVRIAEALKIVAGARLKKGSGLWE